MPEVNKEQILQALQDAGITNLNEFAESLAAQDTNSPFGNLDAAEIPNPGDLVSGGKFIAIFKWDRTADDSAILNSLEDIRSINSLEQQIGE